MNSTAASTLLVPLLLASLQAQGPRPGRTVDWSQVESRVAWHGTWAGALADAKKTNRPILVTSAVPQCQATPGIW